MALPALPTTANTANKDISIVDVIAWADKGLSARQIAKLVGCSHVNIVNRLQHIGYKKERADNFRANKDRVFEHVQQQILESITDADTAKSGLYHKVLGSAILQDKIQTMRGLASVIIDHGQISQELAKVQAEMDEIEKQLAVYDQREARTIDVTPTDETTTETDATSETETDG